MRLQDVLRSERARGGGRSKDRNDSRTHSAKSKKTAALKDLREHRRARRKVSSHHQQPGNKAVQKSSIKTKGRCSSDTASSRGIGKSTRTNLTLDSDDSSVKVVVRKSRPKHGHSSRAASRGDHLCDPIRNYHVRDAKYSNLNNNSSSDEEDEIPYKMNFSQPGKPIRGSSSSGNSSNGSDHDDDDDGYESPPDPDSPEIKASSPTEPLRPGDTIQYENTMIFAAGSGRVQTATVLGTNPEARFPLVLTSGDYLDGTVRVCRTHEFVRGKTYKHAGYWKPIADFRMKDRILKDANGRPVARSGIEARVEDMKRVRECLHNKALEFLRGDYDEHSEANNHRQGNQRASRKPAAIEIDKDEGDSEASSKSSDSELRRELKRVKEQRKIRQHREQIRQQSKHGQNTTNEKKAEPQVLSHENSSCSSDSDDEGEDGIVNLVDRKILNTGERTSSSSKLNLVLQRCSRKTTVAAASKNEEFRKAKSNNSSTEKMMKQPPSKIGIEESGFDSHDYDTEEELRKVKATNKKSKGRNQPRTKATVDAHIDIDSKTEKRGKESKPSISSSFSSSSASVSVKEVSSSPSPKSRKKKKQPPVPSAITMTTVASKVGDAKRSEEWLNDEESSTSSEDSLLLKDSVFLPRETSREQKLGSKHNECHRSPEEENAVDLFEDTSGDDTSGDESGRNIALCRKRNRRGERVLSSPSTHMLHRKHHKQAGEVALFTQEERGKIASRERTLPSATATTSRTKMVKRSVVVGYRPLSFSVNGNKQGKGIQNSFCTDNSEDENSPPSLAKAYRKREEAKRQREREKEREKENDLQWRGDTADSQTATPGQNAGISAKQGRQMKTGPSNTKKSKERQERKHHQRVCIEDLSGTDNKRRLQKAKQKLRQQRARPPPYPRQRLRDPSHTRFDTEEVASTQENEWTDCDDGSFRSRPRRGQTYNRQKRAKASLKKAEQSMQSPESDIEPSEPTTKKRLPRKNPTNDSLHWNSSLTSDDDDKERGKRKRLTPRSRHTRQCFEASDSRKRVRDKQKSMDRYELSSSSEDEDQTTQIPRTPWSTDCEVDSPLPSTVLVAGQQAKKISCHSSTRRNNGGSHAHKSSNGGTKSSVFDFCSQDDNENPSAIEGLITKRNLSPILLASSKQTSSKRIPNRKKTRAK